MRRNLRTPVWTATALVGSVLLLSGGCGRPRPEGTPSHGKTWRITILDLLSAPGSDAARAGVYESLRGSGLREGVDYEVTERNAQGDMANLNTIVDAATMAGVDLFVAISTPALQAAIQKGHQVPTVFTYVASPILAGAGTSDTDHLPWVTGVYTMSDFAGMLRVVRECLPDARRVGTLFCPAEVSSAFYRDELTRAAHQAGIEVEAVPANTSAEIVDAATALCGRPIDAVCQISDNLTSAGFAGIVKGARQATKPLFVFQSSQVEGGAAVGVCRDFEDAGREAGLMVVRVIRGESPAGIPFQLSKANRLLVNPAAARQAGMTLPPALQARADKVVGQ
jgi:ABC-type uncharacterized transport system substrate-binding protein